MTDNIRNIKLTLAYDGSNYSGWQRQSEDMTVQGVLEGRIRVITGESVKLIASGRTDAGVHALGQVCHFHTGSIMDPEELKRGLNSLLPGDIQVLDIGYVPLKFHARYDAKNKTYEYRILNRAEPDIFRRNYLWHIGFPLDIEEMSKCLVFIKGEHDFSSFRSSGSGNSDPVRNLYRSELVVLEDGLLKMVFQANGFLRHMVRNIVGTVVEVGRGKKKFEDLAAILGERDRRVAGVKAPPQGLFLVDVRY